MKIYHNPRCSKSRAGLQYLKEKTTDFEIIQYLKEPLQESDWAEIIQKLGKKPQEIIRKHEAYYKKELKGKEFSYNEWVTILTENPKLISRPIIVKCNKAVIGNPVENIDELF